MKPPTRRRRLLLALPAVAYAVGILLLSSRTGADLPATGVPYGDKALHLAEYFILGVLLVLPLRGLGWRGRGVVVLIGLSFAAFDEVFQTLIPGRMGDPADFASDALGILAAVLLDVLIAPKRNPSNS